MKAVLINTQENVWVQANHQALDYVQGKRKLEDCTGHALDLLEELYVDSTRELWPQRYKDDVNEHMVRAAIRRIRAIRKARKNMPA
jgi:hypothetical protein